MKYSIVAVIAVFAGLVLGGVGPRWDLSKAKERIKDLERNQKRPLAESGSLEGIKTMLKIKDMDEVRKAPPLRKSGSLPANTNSAIPVTASANPSQQTASAVVPNVSSMSNNIETASVLWAARIEMARNNFISNSELKKEEVEMFDTVMEAMNIRLEYAISQWVEKMKDKDQISSEDGIRILNELSQAVVIAYDDMDKSMPQDWRVRSGDEFQMVDFIDPAVAKPLAVLEDKMPGQPRQGWGPPRGGRHRKAPDSGASTPEVNLGK